MGIEPGAGGVVQQLQQGAPRYVEAGLQREALAQLGAEASRATATRAGAFQSAWCWFITALPGSPSSWQIKVQRKGSMAGWRLGSPQDATGMLSLPQLMSWSSLSFSVIIKFLVHPRRN